MIYKHITKHIHIYIYILCNTIVFWNAKVLGVLQVGQQTQRGIAGPVEAIGLLVHDVAAFHPHVGWMRLDPGGSMKLRWAEQGVRQTEQEENRLRGRVISERLITMRSHLLQGRSWNLRFLTPNYTRCLPSDIWF